MISTALPPSISPDFAFAPQIEKCLSTVVATAFDWQAHVEAGDRSVKEMLPFVMLDSQPEVPFIIWLLENPNSPVALPGKIDLYGHDCLHLLLNYVGHSLTEEAFLLGFTMGNDIKTNRLHVWIYKFASACLYPLKYRFNWCHFAAFDDGFRQGRAASVLNINTCDFRSYQHWTIAQLRQHLKLSPKTIGTLVDAL